MISHDCFYLFSDFSRWQFLRTTRIECHTTVQQLYNKKKDKKMLQTPYLWDLKGYWDTGLILSEGPPFL